MPADPIFTITLQKGLANRHRMPLDQVLKVLEQVKQMISEAGMEIQRDQGVERPVSDFGLELVAEHSGRTFRAGSLRARIAITQNAEIGVIAASRVLAAINELARPSADIAPMPPDTSQARIVHRLDKIAFVYRQTKAETKLEVKVPKRFRSRFGNIAESPKPAIVGPTVLENVQSLRTPVFIEHDVRLYGRLFELKERGLRDATPGHFWGELRRDNGERWRVQFTDSQQLSVVPLFRTQVIVSGTAYYYKAHRPRLVSVSCIPDVERDYEAALDELFGCESHRKMDLKTMLDRRYGED